MKCKICNSERDQYDGSCRFDFSDITEEKFNAALKKRKELNKKNPGTKSIKKILMHGFLK